MKKKISDEFVEQFTVSDEKPPAWIDCRPVTFWIPIEAKGKYDLLQQRSRRKFGKFLKQVIEKSIAKVDIDKAA